MAALMMSLTALTVREGCYDEGDGSLSIMLNDYESSMDEVSEGEFMALVDILG